MYACMHVRTYMYVRVRTCVCMCTYICMYVHMVCAYGICISDILMHFSKPHVHKFIFDEMRVLSSRVHTHVSHMSLVSPVVYTSRIRMISGIYMNFLSAQLTEVHVAVKPSSVTLLSDVKTTFMYPVVAVICWGVVYVPDSSASCFCTEQPMSVHCSTRTMSLSTCVLPV